MIRCTYDDAVTLIRALEAYLTDLGYEEYVPRPTFGISTLKKQDNVVVIDYGHASEFPEKGCVITALNRIYPIRELKQIFEVYEKIKTKEESIKEENVE